MVIRTRRSLLQGALGGLGLMASGLAESVARAALPDGANASELLDRLPGKQPLLKRSYRPPNYESPVSYLNDAITPNDRFFVRWHLATIPVIDVDSWHLTVGGDSAARPYELTLAQLQHEFAPFEIVAVCQCALERCASQGCPRSRWLGQGDRRDRLQWRGRALDRGDT
jgi:hypothetical protein